MMKVVQLVRPELEPRFIMGFYEITILILVEFQI
jgi:hypothetical protein